MQPHSVISCKDYCLCVLWGQEVQTSVSLLTIHWEVEGRLSGLHNSAASLSLKLYDGTQTLLGSTDIRTNC